MKIEDVHFLCINLPQSTERREHSLEEFQRCRVPDVHFFEAIDGKQLTPPNPIKGCNLSHRSVWSGIAERDLAVVVFEDDPKLHDSFMVQLMLNIAALPASDKWDIAVLAYRKQPNYSHHRISDRWAVMKNGQFASAMCYLVNGKQGAEKLLTAITNEEADVDLLMSDAIVSGKVSGLMALHPLAWQAGLKTTIERQQIQERQDAATAADPAHNPELLEEELKYELTSEQLPDGNEPTHTTPPPPPADPPKQRPLLKKTAKKAAKPKPPAKKKK